MPPEPLGILLLSGTHAGAHSACGRPPGAGARGRPGVLCATTAGGRGLLADWSELQDAARDQVIRARGVVGLDELREAARELGIRMIACEAGLRAEALLGASPMPGVEIAGVATFLEAVGSGQMLAL